MCKISLLCRRACLGMGFLSTVMTYSSNFLFASLSWMTRWTLPYLTCTYLILLNSVTSCSRLPWISWYLLASLTWTWTHPTSWHNMWMDYHWMGESLHRIVWWIHQPGTSKLTFVNFPFWEHYMLWKVNNSCWLFATCNTPKKEGS